MKHFIITIALALCAATAWGQDDNTVATVRIGGGTATTYAIGSDYATTLDAFNAAASAANNAAEAATLTLLKNVDLGERDEGIGLGSAAGVTLDLNGHSITGDVYGDAVINVGDIDVSNVKLTVTDKSGGGSISNNGIYSMVIWNNGELTVSGGTVSGADTGINNYEAGTLSVEGGTVVGNTGIYNTGAFTLSGGTVSSTSTLAANNDVCISNFGTLTLSGGAVRGTVDGNDVTPRGIYNSGTLNFARLTTFENVVTGIDLALGYKIGFSGTVAIGSGTVPITVKVYVAAPYVFTTGYADHVKADGSEETADPAGLFDVKFRVGGLGIFGYVAGTVVVEGGEVKVIDNSGNAAYVVADGTTTGYGTLPEAVNAIMGPASTITDAAITLMADAKLYDDSWTYSFSLGTLLGVTLDLNGYNIVGNLKGEFVYDNEAFITVPVGSTLILVDNRGGGVISNIGQSGTVIKNNGTLRIRDVEIKADGYNITAIKNNETNNIKGVLNVEGGRITSNGEYCYGIINYGEVWFTALPVFSGSDDRDSDIHFIYDGSIGFKNGNFEVPATPIKVSTFEGNLMTLTKDYSKYVRYGNDDERKGQVIPPANIFAYTGTTTDVVTVLNASGEAEFLSRPAAVAVNFAKEGFATYYDSQFDLVLPDGMRAYVVTDGTGDGTLSYEKSAANVVPAATAVLLQVPAATATGEASAAAKTIGFSAGADYYTGANMLRGSDVATATTGGGLYYKLTYGTGDMADVFGWFWGTDGGAAFESGAHKVWLVLPAAAPGNARFLALPGYEGDASGIGTTGVTDGTDDTAWYTLDGRRLSVKPTQSGLYINNGKKVAIK